MSGLKAFLVFCIILQFFKPLQQSLKGIKSTCLVAILEEEEFHCTGVLIHPMYVLTAGHCVKGSPKKYAIVDNPSRTDNIVAVTDIIRPHTKVNEEIGCETDDIVMLRLERAINCEPIVLNEDDLGIKDNFVLRWNREKNGNETVYHRESIPIDIYDPNACRQAEKNESYIYDNICGAPTINTDLLSGNSGSPLFTQNGTKLVLIGILYCKLLGVINSTFPAAFVNISKHYEWIANVIGSPIEETTINTDVTTNSDTTTNHSHTSNVLPTNPTSLLYAGLGLFTLTFFLSMCGVIPWIYKCFADMVRGY